MVLGAKAGAATSGRLVDRDFEKRLSGVGHLIRGKGVVMTKPLNGGRGGCEKVFVLGGVGSVRSTGMLLRASPTVGGKLLSCRVFA